MLDRAAPRSRVALLGDPDRWLCWLAVFAGLAAVGYLHSHQPTPPVAERYVSESPGPVRVVWEQSGPSCGKCGCEVPRGRDWCYHCGCKLDWRDSRSEAAAPQDPGGVKGEKEL